MKADHCKADPRGVLTGTTLHRWRSRLLRRRVGLPARASPPDIPLRLPLKLWSASLLACPPWAEPSSRLEDELAASITLQGAVWGGAKAFTVTSGPGFSLMMETSATPP